MRHRTQEELQNLAQHIRDNAATKHEVFNATSRQCFHGMHGICKLGSCDCPCHDKSIVTDDSGALTLPWVLFGLVGYVLFHMVSTGVFQALTALQVR